LNGVEKKGKGGEKENVEKGKRGTFQHAAQKGGEEDNGNLR